MDISNLAASDTMAYEEEKINIGSANANVGECEAHLIKEYGVIHLKNALSEAGQKDLWALTKPHVSDPKGRATGFSNWSICSKNGKEKRNPHFDQYGRLLFNLSAKELVKHVKDEDDIMNEPAYKHLHEIENGARQIHLD